MSLVRGRIFGRRTISIALELSSYALQCTIGSSEKTSKLNLFIYLINPISGIKYLNECDKETYSACVDASTMPVCSLDAHTIGQPA